MSLLQYNESVYAEMWSVWREMCAAGQGGMVPAEVGGEEMTKSKEYQESDKFKRKLLREIKAGNYLIKMGWNNTSPRDVPLPADVHTLESVLKWYNKFLETHDWVSR